MFSRLFLLLATMVAANACAGAVRDKTPAPGASPAALPEAGPMPLRRLTRLELRNTLRDLDLVPEKELGELTRDLPDDARGAFGFDVAPTVSNLEVDRFLAVAEAIGRSVVGRPEALARLATCDPARGDEVCARAFIKNFGRRAFRRPLAPPEVETLAGLYRSARKDLRYDSPDAIRVVLQVMLQSPFFLYRWELGPETPAPQGALVRLDGHETAARLSYFLWSSMPDQRLFSLADTGGLQTPAQVEAEARRMVMDPRAKDTIRAFHDQWLGLDKLDSVQKDPKILKTFREALNAMGTETRTFIDHVFTEGNGSLDLLLGAPYTFVNERLARHYGIDGVSGKEFRRVDLNPDERLGILTQGAFLAIHSPPNGTSPVRRGKIVLEHLLCAPPPPPPEGLEIMPPAPDPNLQTREQFEDHVLDVGCAGCHVQMDGIGFTFEGYDTLGRLRTTEAERPVNTEAEIPSIDGKPHKIRNAAQLMKVLSTSDQVRQCLVRQWTRFALGRLETPQEEDSLRAAHRAFVAARNDMRALMVAITTTKAFLHRSANPWETTP